MEECKRQLLLSVVIPVCNGENYIEALTEAIDRQQRGQLEAIFVDDGSRDGTYELCRKAEQKYDWMRLCHTENHGVSHARNFGMERARGQWIHFVDVDDELHPELFSKFSEAARSLPEAIICGCRRENLSTGEDVYCGPEKSESVFPEEYAQFFRGMKMEKRYWALDYVWNKWYRNDVIQKYGLRFLEELSLGEDFEFNTRYFAKISSMELIGEPLYHYQINAGGLASRFCPEPWKGRNMLYDAHVQLCRTLGVWDTEQPEIDGQAGQIAFGDIRMINSPNCSLNIREKKLFVRKMKESRQFPLILGYLKSRRSVKYKIYEKIFRTGSAGAATALISLEKCVKRRK